MDDGPFRSTAAQTETVIDCATEDGGPVADTTPSALETKPPDEKSRRPRKSGSTHSGMRCHTCGITKTVKWRKIHTEDGVFWCVRRALLSIPSVSPRCIGSNRVHCFVIVAHTPVQEL